MELHSRVYYKHPDAKIMGQLEVLFKEHEGNAERFLQAALAINPESVEAAQDLLDQIDSPEYDLEPESLYYEAGYAVLDFVHGSSGDENIENILLFLKALLPEIHAQAWGCGDDDPWEFWFKFNGDELIREDDEPFNDPEEDENIKASIYAWWHKDLPIEIKEGFLNEA
ncbi:hypothetical protein EXE30_13615 [Acinetobacter halotolerans]|uniref:Uncharacterized protein n=1 Tax=Acinetobacter halotolerans TaxID=1752076 RepID=A0A4Q6XGL5_9GAMM|nr:hypothetical protein [Acinetobacter halotolerans]MDR7017539.1 hypothetical protein [Prolinoborus sp. 3657]RZF49977.1 hypothetical protein EXE30_13615 [Acinetobacter halotolerans]